MRMSLYSFGISGASPGIGGGVVVVAGTLPSAIKLAESAVSKHNAARSAIGMDNVTLDTKPQYVEQFMPPGVVHFYDGEA